MCVRERKTLGDESEERGEGENVFLVSGNRIEEKARERQNRV